MSKISLHGVSEEVNVSGVLRYFPRRGFDEGPSISLSKQSKKIENRNKEDKKSIKQPKSTGAKLATFFTSFFKQSILKKKSKSTTTVTKEDACMSRRSISFPQVIKTTRKDNCVALDSERNQDCHEARVQNERSKSVDGNSTNKWLLDMEAKLWSEEFFRKEEKWRRRKSEEEDEGSESSSDLFELQNYDLIDGVSTNL